MNDRFNIFFFIIALGSWALYLLGGLFPELFWAFNPLGILPIGLSAGFFGLAIILISTPLWLHNSWANKWGLENFSIGKTATICISVLVAILFLLFPISRDIYGDALFIADGVDLEIPNWDSRLLVEPLQPDWFNTKIGLRTYYELNNIFTWIFGVNGKSVTPFLNAAFGGLFVFVWIRLVLSNFKRSAWQWTFIVVGVTSPLLAVFMGHFETYFLSYAAILLWFLTLQKYFRTESTKWLIALPFLFLIVLQTHITNWLLLPSLVFAVAWHYRNKVAFFQNVLTPKGLFIYLFVPFLLVLLVAYVFIFENHDGPRQFSKQEFEDALFLPLFTNEAAPLERYNLFSVSHIWDYFNLMFMWSGAVLVLLVPALTFLRKQINWKAPFLLITGYSAIVFFVVFFILNPLLGSPSDWDLFSAPALVVLPFLLGVYGQMEEKLDLRQIAGPVLGACILGLPFLIMNSENDMLSEKYWLTGKWEFKTYWMGSSTGLLTWADMAASPAEKQERVLALVRDLEPFATPSNDREYAALLTEAGLFYRSKNKEKAISYFQEARLYSPKLGTNLYYLTVTQFEMGQLDSAFQNISQLVKLKYQPYNRTLKMAIHISLAAEEYQSAANYSFSYLKRWQDDPAITEIEMRLRTGDDIYTLVNLFDVE